MGEDIQAEAEKAEGEWLEPRNRAAARSKAVHSIDSADSGAICCVIVHVFDADGILGKS